MTPTDGLRRRDFLGLLGACTALWACGERLPESPRIGLALGGGGAKGIAHVLMLEVFDELGIRPHRIAGTSIGAVMGALYAGGMSGAGIHALIDRLTVSEDESWMESVFDEEVLRWLEFIDPTTARGGLIESGAFIRFLREQITVERFADLRYPLQVVATDFWQRDAVVFDSGELFPAVQASMAVPGLFPPVQYRGRLLVDGGLVNPVPWDLLLDDCDLVVAVDVLGERTAGEEAIPSVTEITFNSFQIMQAAIIAEKLRRQPPAIYIRPDIENVRVLEFYKAGQILAQSRPARDRLRRELQRRL